MAPGTGYRVDGVALWLYTLLRDEWGSWAYGPDEAIETDDPGLQAEIDLMMRRVNRLERSQEAAIRRQQAVAGR